MQHSAGFPETDADILLDWSTHPTAADTQQAISLQGVTAHPGASDAAFVPELQQSDSGQAWGSGTINLQQQSHAGSLRNKTELAGQVLSFHCEPQLSPSVMAPCMSQMPKLAPLDMPPEMPFGPSIATARVSLNTKKCLFRCLVLSSHLLCFVQASQPSGCCSLPSPDDLLMFCIRIALSSCIKFVALIECAVGQASTQLN